MEIRVQKCRHWICVCICMHPIKGFLAWAVMLTGIRAAFADGLAVTALTPIEIPALTTNGLGIGFPPRTDGVVAVSGTNAIFVWNGQGYARNTETFSTICTNLFLNEINSSGVPDGSMKFLGTTISVAAYPRLLAADLGFFATYVRFDDVVFTRLDRYGDP